MKHILREGREELHLDIESFSQYKFINTKFILVEAENVDFSNCVFINTNISFCRFVNCIFNNTKFVECISEKNNFIDCESHFD